MAASGAALVQEFEDHLKSRSRKVRLSNGLWARYMRGEVIPQGARGSGSTTLIERIEAIYPGTAAIFHSPLWELMEFDKVLDPYELKNMFLRLGEEAWTCFVDNYKSLSTTAVAASRYWLVKASENELLAKLRKLGGFDGLCSCLILARLGYLKQEETLFVTCMHEARRILITIGHSAEFSPAKMQPAILLIEGLWLAHTKQHLVAAPKVREDVHQLSDYTIRWEQEWQRAADAHAETLPKTSRTAFGKWLDESQISASL